MPSDQIAFRTYQSGDEDAVRSLYRLAYGVDLSPDYWKWLHLGGATNRGVASVATTGNNLVGYTGGTSATFRRAPTVLAGTRHQNSMVDPRYRRRGIYTRLINHLDDCMQSASVALCYAFPRRQNSLATFLHRCAYTHVAELVTMQISCDVSGRPGRPVIAEAKFDDADATLVSELLPRNLLLNRRGLSYLQWRYASHPIKRYWVARLEDAGFAVFKAYGPEKTMDLCELLCQPGYLREFLGAIADFGREGGAETISIWSMEHYPSHQELIDLGFSPCGHRTHVVCKWLSSDPSDQLSKPENWYITLGDSDVY